MRRATHAPPVQTGVAPGTIDLKRAAIPRGRVLDRGGSAVPGVRIDILAHPEFGQTLTRALAGFRRHGRRGDDSGGHAGHARGSEGIGRAFFCALVGQRIVVLHGFVKKTQTTPKAELRTARRRMEEVHGG